VRWVGGAQARVDSGHQVSDETGSILDLAGSVTWEWLAGCRECGAPHEYRPDPRAHGLLPGDKPVMTWASPVDGHTYRPRVPRWTVDTLLIEQKMEEQHDVAAASDG